MVILRWDAPILANLASRTVAKPYFAPLSRAAREPCRERREAMWRARVPW